MLAYWFECIYLGISVNKLYGVGVRALVPWYAVFKVFACAVLAAGIAFGITYNLRETLLGVLIGAAIYGVAFVVLLRFSGLDEAQSVLAWVKGLIPVPARGS